MAARGQKEREAELKSSNNRSDLYISSDQNKQRPASKMASSTAAWDKQGHLHGVCDEPEVKRQRRIAKYKTYAVESKFKASLRSGIRWVKIKCSDLLHR